MPSYQNTKATDNKQQQQNRKQRAAVRHCHFASPSAGFARVMRCLIVLVSPGPKCSRFSYLSKMSLYSAIRSHFVFIPGNQSLARTEKWPSSSCWRTLFGRLPVAFPPGSVLLAIYNVS